MRRKTRGECVTDERADIERPKNWLHHATKGVTSCSVQPTSVDAIPSSGLDQADLEHALQLAFVNVGRRLRAAFRTDPAAVGVLQVLARFGAMRVSALAEALVLDISTTSRHVSALESDGQVAREVDPADRRACLVVITPAGSAFLAEALRDRADVLGAATRDWTAQDVTTLVRLLDRLADDLTGGPTP